MSNKLSEAYILKKITQRLHFNKKVLFYLRVHCGGYGTSSGGFVQLAPTGTPDLLIVLKTNDGVKVLFLEVKKEGVTRLRYEQKKFFEKYEGTPGIYCRVINDVGDLDGIIMEVIYG